MAPNQGSTTNRDEERARYREALRGLDWLLGERGGYAPNRGNCRRCWTWTAWSDFDEADQEYL